MDPQQIIESLSCFIVLFNRPLKVLQNPRSQSSMNCVTVLQISIVSHIYIHSPARAAFLHDLCSVVSRQLAEAVITINYRPVHNLSVPQQETCL